MAGTKRILQRHRRPSPAYGLPVSVVLRWRSGLARPCSPGAGSGTELARTTKRVGEWVAPQHERRPVPRDGSLPECFELRAAERGGGRLPASKTLVEPTHEDALG